MLSASCTKDKVPFPPDPPVPEVWEKFIGQYNVYDTNGGYLYEMQIKNIYHDKNLDSIVMINFNQNFNLKFQFYSSSNQNQMFFGFNDSITGFDNHSWQVYSDLSNPNTDYLENEIHGDTLFLSFEQTNIKYWVNEGVSYYSCNCKQIAIKTP